MGPSVSDPGPGSSLWRTIFASGPDVGPLVGGHRAALGVAKRLCGAGDWLDSTGMPRPYRSSRRPASAGDPVEVRRLLQWDSDTLIAGEGRARVAECAATEPGQTGGGATRRWAPSRIPAADSVSRSDQEADGTPAARSRDRRRSARARSRVGARASDLFLQHLLEHLLVEGEVGVWRR
jgi:hypothetical protein